MSTNVVAFISEDDETYQKHAKVLRACIDAGIEKLPKETAEYFDLDYPEEYLFEEKLETPIKTHKWGEDMRDGFEIYVSEIPEGVHKIRFYNSY